MSTNKSPTEFKTINVSLTEPTRKTHANRIRTTKYNAITWLPKSLFEQFRRVANLYFLLISVLMLIGTYATFLFQSPLEPFSTIAVLLIILLITSTKEGYEDLQRGKADKIENDKEVITISFPDINGPAVETKKCSSEINPGDIIKIVGEKSVPVDLVLILTSMYEDGNKCYIETANLDGETNLKLKEAPAQLLTACNKFISNGIAVSDLFDGELEVELPNKNMHTFVGSLQLKNLEETIAITPQNVILRGSVFSNTDWAYGIAVYTGRETKIMMSNQHAPSKLSKLEMYLNTAIIIIFFAQITLVSMSVMTIYLMGFNNFNSKLPYVYPFGEGTGSVLPLWLEQWFVFFLLYNNFIPLSLYVSIEVVNLCQSYLISSDELIYSEALDLPCSVRSSNLVQEIGMVSNIFSDKTGTLTRNEMKLVKYVIDGITFDVPDVGMTMNEAFSGQQEMKSELKSENFINFFRCLITCHTVVREKTGVYRAESPDELALVEGAAHRRCFLWERGSHDMHVELFGEKLTFEVLAVNAFNADRKRMSVLVRDCETNRYFVMCKGADNIMLPLCSITNPEQLEEINVSLIELANKGLRTLIIAEKEMTKEDAMKWLSQFKVAATSIKDREEQLSESGKDLERGLTFVGITAIEDRLQDQVPEVIQDLNKAGIILWMLTGDKLETAISIAKSCNLLIEDTILYHLTGLHNPDEFFAQLKKEYERITTATPISDNNKNQALILEGPSFAYFDNNSKESRKMLLTLGQRCRSVVACRLTPTQKRDLVSLVKKDSIPRAITLSIGDGANDVPMIMEGDVGVGIYGKEGRQAANNADFAIGEFKFLRRLLLVHGRWNYIRQAKVFLYSMHKNMVMTFTLFWYSFYNAISGTSIYETWIYGSFNIVLFLPIIVYGFLDRDISADFALQYPQVYISGPSNYYLKISAILMWIWNAMLYAVVLCVVYYLVMASSFEMYDVYSAGTTLFVGMVLALQLKVSFFYHQWANPQIYCMTFSVVAMFLFFLLIANSVDDYWYIATWLYSQGLFWFFGFFSGPLFTFLVDLVGYCLYKFFWPSKDMIAREVELALLEKKVSSTEKDDKKDCLFSVYSQQDRSGDSLRPISIERRSDSGNDSPSNKFIPIQFANSQENINYKSEGSMRDEELLPVQVSTKIKSKRPSKVEVLRELI